MCSSGAMYESNEFEGTEGVFDRCVMTGEITPYLKTDHISIRKYYIEGVGQLSKSAWEETYGE